jgi:acyl carrier protein
MPTPQPDIQAAMTHDDITRQIRESISRITGIPADDIGERASFQKDLGLDSLSLLELVVHLEYGFKIKVPEDALQGLHTVHDTAAYVRQRIDARV